MIAETWLPPLAGGLLIGAAAALLLVLTGRIAGISGMLRGLVLGPERGMRVLFLLGLVLGAGLMGYGQGSLPQARGLADGKGPAASSAPRATSAGTDARGVKQASASDAAKAGAGQPRLPAQAAAAPRWRDRLRFAWPTTK